LLAYSRQTQKKASRVFGFSSHAFLLRILVSSERSRGRTESIVRSPRDLAELEPLLDGVIGKNAGESGKRSASVDDISFTDRPHQIHPVIVEHKGPPDDLLPHLISMYVIPQLQISLRPLQLLRLIVPVVQLLHYSKQA